jgi:uncharacterized protein YgiM (DUF1202 family)
MKKYSISIDKVVRHFDASRKICPQSMSLNNWSKWQSFKNQLTSDVKSKPQQNIAYGTVTADVLNVRSGPGTNYEIIGQLKKGQKVRLDIKIENWQSIYFGDHGGFVSSYYIE